MKSKMKKSKPVKKSVIDMPETSPEVMSLLVKIFQAEMSGIIRYLHYSFMIMGHHRIPIQGWLRAQAAESQAHATLIGEKITSYGGHPPMISAHIEETHEHSVDAILAESLEFESQALNLYSELAKVAAAAEDVALEELAREMVRAETEHLDEVRKMLRIYRSRD
jgi:bacterioferritin